LPDCVGELYRLVVCDLDVHCGVLLLTHVVAEFDAVVGSAAILSDEA
jgi:hypothetical protein